MNTVGQNVPLGSGTPSSDPTSTRGSVHMKTNFTVTSASILRVGIHITNSGNEDIYVLNRLWRLEAKNNHPVLDPEHVYCFFQDGTLRLLLGASPLPKRLVTYSNRPCATRLKAHSDLQLDIEVPVPVSEHSAYFFRNDTIPMAPVQAKQIELIVQYVTARPDVTATPSAFLGSTALDLNAAAVKTRLSDKDIELLRSSVPVPGTGLQVLKYTGELSRPILPGDLPVQSHHP